MNLDFTKTKFVALSAAMLAGSMWFAPAVYAQASAPAAVASQSDMTLKGQVVDATGEPLTGVSVVVVGSGTGTSTNIDGEFSLKVKTGQELRFSYVGFKAQTLKVTNAGPVTITLQEDSNVLDEVVVTALGLKKEAKSLSYNVQQVDNDALTRIADANLVNNLNGKIAGVNINASSSGVGGSSRVVMRGAKSISGNNNALYVVDGIPLLDMSRANEQPTGVYEGAAQSGDPISTINPEDIESISVLSGPSAAALYGSAAANGVIIITTKKGQEGVTKLTISNNTTFSRPLCTPEFNRWYGQTETGSFSSWGEKMTKKSDWNPTDFFQTGYNVTNSAALTTGTAKNQTYFSLGTTNARGVIHNNDYSRYNATVRNTTKMIDDRLTMDLNFGITQIKEKNMTSQGLYFNPLVPLYLIPAGDDFNKIKAFERYDNERDLMTQFWPYADGLGLQNPYWITEHISMPNTKNRYNGSAQFSFKVNDWLNLTARAKIDRMNETHERKYDAGTNQMYASKYGFYSKTNVSNQQVYGEFLASVNKYFGHDNMINLVANVGANFEDTHYQSDYFGGQLKSVANLFTWANVDTSVPGIQNAHQDGYKLKKRAVFGTMQLGYKSMAYLDVAARNDWSSTFKGTSTNSFFYPSIGLSGIITDIFGIRSNILNFAKVRVSYSEVGNSPEVFVAIPTYELSNGSPVTSTRRPNSDLKPERTKSWEAGLNLWLFNNKLRVDATLYSSRTYNQFFTRTLAASTGYTSEIINGGRVDNKGIELSARLNNTFGDFQWSTYITYTLNRNKVKELVKNYKDPYTGEIVNLDKIEMASTSMYKMILTEGGSIGDIYVNTLKTDEHGSIYLEYPSNTVVADRNNFVKAGSANPKYNLSWGNEFFWKGFNLSFLATARVGGIGVSQTQAVMDFFGASKASADGRDKGVIINGRPIPAQGYFQTVGAEGNNGGVGSQYVYSATNVRLAELTFGYTFPIKKWVPWMQELNVSFIGRNLFFFYKKAPYDPELTASTGTYFQGIDNFMTPSLRNLGFSVKVSF